MQSQRSTDSPRGASTESIDGSMLGGNGSIRQLSLFKHLKKKAANDAQLLMNRIALLQKEEERAQRKIEQTKERANAILAVREMNERAIEEWVAATEEEKIKCQQLRQHNVAVEEETKAMKARQTEMIAKSKRDSVKQTRVEKHKLRNDVIKMKEDDVRRKMERYEELKRQEQETRLKKEQKKKEYDLMIKQKFEQKARMEADEVRRAEELVRTLEQREREWIERLRETQTNQEKTYIELESTLTQGSPERRNPSTSPEVHNNLQRSRSGGSTAGERAGNSREAFNVNNESGPMQHRVRSSEAKSTRKKNKH